jgi:hypothetical protein
VKELRVDAEGRGHAVPLRARPRDRPDASNNARRLTC